MSNNWPRHVVIREWVFKDKAKQDPVLTDPTGSSSASKPPEVYVHHTENDNDIITSDCLSDDITLMDHGVTSE